ncbi:MlaD family protein [Nocardia bovistercoris]|uniref:MCE family protein n=1 Tax=Nocardia bovistercoris TaxID=2785916 RepID=A0A931N4W5_9NOCA|nr:MCE family protein [Nocardia bovistercoris]MBH0778043.1 MCE family protein [Nocardia bovistercoris]
MSVLFDKDGRGPSVLALLLRGVLLVALVAGGVTVVLLKSAGTFETKAEVEAMLAEVGDGLPPNSDVKFRGVLVGTVAEVIPAIDGGRSRVRLRLDPGSLASIPDSVTARVVPSNIFAVSSVQLVDNGPGRSLREGAQIPQDTSLSTVQLQTALTKLRDIVAATARIGTSGTVGVLASVAKATDRRGTDIVEAGAQLERITAELSAQIAPPGQPSTIAALTESVQGLATAAPDLLDVLHHAVVPMRTVVEQDARLRDLLAAGTGTLSTVEGGLDRHVDEIVTATDQLTPVLDVFAAGSSTFGPIVGRIRRLSDVWFAEFWNEKTQSGTGKFQIRFTPDTAYVRADCPRYGELEGPSCRTAPVSSAPQPLPASLDPRSVKAPALTPELQDLIGRVLGGDANAAEQVLSQLLTTGIPGTGGAPR